MCRLLVNLMTFPFKVPRETQQHNSRSASINRRCVWLHCTLYLNCGESNPAFLHVILTYSLLSWFYICSLSCPQQQTCLKIVLETKSRYVWKMWHRYYYDRTLHAREHESISYTKPKAQYQPQICLLNGLDRWDFSANLHWIALRCRSKQLSDEWWQWV